MVDSLWHDKNYWIVFLAKYPSISEKNANYFTLKHSNSFEQRLNVYWVDFGKCCIVLGAK